MSTRFRMKTVAFQTLSAIAVCAGSGCSLMHSADIRHSRPLVLSLDVAPGYGNGVFLDASEGVTDLLVQRKKSSPTEKWAPTFFVSYHSDKSGNGYYLHLSVDPRLEEMYAETRLFDEETQSIIRETRLPQPYSLRHKFRVRAELSGKCARFYIDGQLVGDQELTKKPRFLELGASSGKFNVRLDSSPPPAESSSGAGS